MKTLALVTFSLMILAQTKTVDFGPDDPVANDKQHYKVELENEHVRVVRVKYGPREKGPMHEHRCGRVSVLLTPLVQTLVTPDGAKTETRGAPGDVRWSGEARHADENLVASPMELISIDVKSACGAPAARASGRREAPRSGARERERVGVEPHAH
jgi:hypothetical protein